MLEEIANQCPLEGGKGVYMARGILAEYSLEETLYDDLAKCTPVTPRVARILNSKISVYPNPSQETFFVKSSSLIEKVVVTDLSGKLIYKNKIPVIKLRYPIRVGCGSIFKRKNKILVFKMYIMEYLALQMFLAG
ncbi:MAG: T9SS type A sorting domain-containing protein [Saprospiraceae bacterium]|nr:T9SS type A sorting domain-containing protein [Saprospiraceae bacterium]